MAERVLQRHQFIHYKTPTAGQTIVPLCIDMPSAAFTGANRARDCPSLAAQHQRHLLHSREWPQLHHLCQHSAHQRQPHCQPLCLGAQPGHRQDRDLQHGSLGPLGPPGHGQVCSCQNIMWPKQCLQSSTKLLFIRRLLH